MKRLKFGLALVLVLALAIMAGLACGGGGADFELSGLTITPSEVGVDEEATIRVTVENVGDDEGSTEVTLKVDGEEVDSQNVTVSAGMTRTLTFTHSEAEAGTYDIEIDGQTGTLTVTAGPGPTPTPTPGAGPGVGSTWEYLVDYDGEVDWPYTTTLTELNVTPPALSCVPPAGVSITHPLCNHYVTDTHPDGACPPNPTAPKRSASGFTAIPLSAEVWINATNGTSAALLAPVCMTAPIPLGLCEAMYVFTGYTAVSGTIGKPYAVGDKWTYTSYTDADLLGDCIAAGTQSSTAEIVAVNESVTVPAGTFTDCVKMVETMEGVTGSKITWWSSTVQYTVKQIDETSYAGFVQTQELASYDLK